MILMQMTKRGIILSTFFDEGDLVCFMWFNLTLCCLYNRSIHTSMTIQVVMATSMKMAVFWDVALCSLIDISRRFGGDYCFYHHLRAASNIGQYPAEYKGQNPEANRVHE
jgi:hypothetical protein